VMWVENSSVKSLRFRIYLLRQQVMIYPD
jgi:hypothetical protein